MPNLLARTVTEAAQRFGDRRVARGPTGVELTYVAFDRRSDEVAAWLQARGVAPGQVVALALPSSVEHLVLMAALAKIGAAYAGINPRLRPDERATALDVIAPDLVIGSSSLLDELSLDVPAVLLEPAGAGADVAAGIRIDGAEPVAVEDDPERPVAIVLTSGTTGRPKAAVFTDREVDAIRRLDVGDAWGGGGAMLVSTELCHVGIATKLAWYLRLGATLHLLARWRASDALDVIERERVASVGGISSQFALLLRDPGFDQRDLSHVTSLISGGGPCTPGLISEARERFGAPFSVRYSSTESGGVGCGTAFDAPDDEALFTVGRPRAGVEVRIDEDDRVLLRSPAVMRRYHHAPEATAQVLVDGWLRTSDRGHLDEQGRLVLDGRVADSWVRGGHNVWPEPVEAVLSTHPEVGEVAVVPRADDVMGHIGVAVVVPKDPVHPPTLEALRAHAAPHLAKWQLPEALRVHRRQLPRTAVDKVDRRRLRALE